MKPGPADAQDLDRLRAEVGRLRKERDALSARVIELEKQVALQASAPAVPASAPTALEESFRIEQSRAKRQRLPLSLALVEADGLQQDSDRPGARDDEALGQVERVLAGALRPTDVVARVEGHRLAVLLSATGLEQALAAMTRMQRAMSSAPSSGAPADGAASFCAGLAQWREDESLGDLIARASRSLALARRGGSGRIVVG